VLISDPFLIIKTRRVLKLSDKFKRKLHLFCEIANLPELRICKKATIYSEYWIDNQTGLHLLYKERPSPQYDYAAGQTDLEKELRQEPTGDPREWYYLNKSEGSSTQILQYSKPTLCIRVGSSEWSQEVQLSSQNADTVADVLVKGKRLYPFRINILQAPGKFHRTKVIKIFPSYILVNRTGRALLYRHRDQIFSLQPNDEIPFYWPSSAQTSTRKIRIRLDPRSSDYSNTILKENEILDESFWSAGFFLANGNDFFQVKLRDVSAVSTTSDDHSGDNKKITPLSHVMVSVNIKSMKETTFVVFEKQEHSLYQIDNKTSEVIFIQQKGGKVKERINPHSCVPFCWEEPHPKEPKKLLVLPVVQTSMTSPLSTTQESAPTLRSENAAALASVRSHQLTPRIPVGISEVNFDVVGQRTAIPLPGRGFLLLQVESLGGPRKCLRIIHSATHTVPTHSPLEQNNQKTVETPQKNNTPERKLTLEFTASFASVGISIMSAETSWTHRQKEVMYILFRDMWAKYVIATTGSTLDFKLKGFQVDNQLYGTILPVAILSDIVGMSGSRTKEFISFVLKREPKFNTLKLSINIGEFDLQIDQTFLLQTLALVAFILKYFNERSASIEEKKLFMEFKHRAQKRLRFDDVASNLYYVEDFYINHLRTRLTFRGEGNAATQDIYIGETFESILKWIPFTIIARATNAPLVLDPFVIKHTFILSQDIVTRVVDHYKRWQMYAKQMWNKLEVIQVSHSLTPLGDVQLGTVVIRRARRPRYFGPDQLLTPFDSEKADGQYIMSAVDTGHYATEFYSWHCWLVKDTWVLLSTTQKLLFCRWKDSEWTSVWTKPANEPEVKITIVRLKSAFDKYLTAERNGKVFANRSEGEYWEQWLVEKRPEYGKGKVNLRSFHGKYLCVDALSNVVADRSEAKDWELFHIVKLGKANQVALLAHNVWCHFFLGEIRQRGTDWASDCQPS